MSKDLIYDKPISYKNIINFTLPTMARMVFISIYTIVDGIVLSNYVGSVGLSAVNIVYPILNIVMAVTFVLTAGGNAIIGKKLGEGKTSEANSFLSFLVIANMAIMGVLMAIFFMWEDKIYFLLGSDEYLLPYCEEYGRIMVIAGPIWSLQIMFQNYLITADRPRMAMNLSIASGVVNVVLDIVFVGYLHMGIKGAAFASLSGMIIGGLIPLSVFFNKDSLIHFAKPQVDMKELMKAFANGSSEMVVNLSSAITTTLFNLQMMEIVGEKGVAAISAILYIQFIYAAIMIGFTSGISPIFSYNFGAENKENIKKLFAIAIRIVCLLSVGMFLLAEALNWPITMIFASKDEALASLMIEGFKIVALSILFTGINVFASGFFTAMNNGKISAIISFLRTFLLEAGALILLPIFFDLDGVWWALPFAEIAAALVALWMLARYKKQYGY